MQRKQAAAGQDHEELKSPMGRARQLNKFKNSIWFNLIKNKKYLASLSDDWTTRRRKKTKSVDPRQFNTLPFALAHNLLPGCQRLEPTLQEQATLTDFRIYIVWRIGDSQALQGVHWGVGNNAYLGLLKEAGNIVGKLQWQRVKHISTSSTWVAEAQHIWATCSAGLGRAITPPV